MVSVLLPTFNRPRYLTQALASVLRQSYRNLQVIIINDGGEDVSDIVTACGDPRIMLINRKDNRGKAFSLNEGLARAEGKYIAYIDDDDIYYPNHIATLVNVLEKQTDCQVAYSDLYKVACRVMPDGGRLALSKVVEVSRDFERFVMLYFNHVLHVSLVHRRELIEKTGLYNEKLSVLIDWDMTRRLAFFSDFCHVCEITGEYYNPVGESDRISVQQRRDKNEYLRNALTIRTTRPPKPWSKIEDMAIIFITTTLDKQAAATIGSIWRYTFYPYIFYLPVPPLGLQQLETTMPNVVPVFVDPHASETQRVDAALAECEGEYVVIVPSGYDICEMWVEDALYALINEPVAREGFELEGSSSDLWAVVLRKSDLEYARTSFANLSARESLQAAGIVLKRLHADQIPFQFDQLLGEARRADKSGNCARAAEMFEYIAANYKNEFWMNTLAAKSFFKAGNYAKASELSRQLNQRRPTVDTLLLEAKIRRREDDSNSAIGLLERAEDILEGKTLSWK
ncbi:MAG: glycosyltransferase [Planctomycetota bacterium]